MLNKLEEYLVKLLQGRLTGDVQVVKHYSQRPGLPVVTLDTNIGITTEENREHLEDDLGEYIIYHRHAQVNINVWANTEEERQRVCKEIMELYYMDQSFHYTTCVNYADGDCTSLDEPCKARSMLSERAVKGQCPEPELYGYHAWWYELNIHPGTIIISPPRDLDERDVQPVLYHSVLECECDYFDRHTLGGLTYNSVEFPRSASVTVSPVLASMGDVACLEATVSLDGVTAGTGRVRFYLDTGEELDYGTRRTVIGSAPVEDGIARTTWTVPSTLDVGCYTLLAVYEGDTSHDGSGRATFRIE